MAEALVAPLIQNHIQPSSKIAVYDVCTNTMNRVCETYQVQPSSSIAECINEADLICIAVKPQNCDVVFKEIREATATDSPSKVSIHPDATLLSIVAGKPMKAFHESSILRIARSMPNTVSSPSLLTHGIPALIMLHFASQ
jgi:pyrroline-5-carboxylate reductase